MQLYDILRSLVTNFMLVALLFTLVTVLMYLAMFLSLRKTLREAELRVENLKIQSDRNL